VPYASFGDPQSLNLYGYVRNDPVTRADKDGHVDDLCKGRTDCYMTNAANGVTTVNVYSSTQTKTTNADGSTTITGTFTVQTYNFNQAGEMTSATQQTEVTTSTISQSGTTNQTQTSETSTTLNRNDAIRQFGNENLGAFQQSFIDTRGTLARLPGTVAADAHAHPWAYAGHTVELGALFVPVAGELELYKAAVEDIVGVGVLLNELGDPDPDK
jgi:hypothetical protein